MRNERRWYRGSTAGEVLRNQAQNFPGQTAIVCSEASIRMSYVDYDRAVDQVAKSLLAWNINKGDHVAVMSPDVPEWLLLQLATARIGAIMVPINPNFSAEFLFMALKQCDIKAVFVMDSYKTGELLSKFIKLCPEVNGSVIGDLNCAMLPILKLIVYMRRSPLSDILHWKTFLESGKGVHNSVLHEAEIKTYESDVMVIQYTSASTGMPKPAVLTHKAILSNALYTTERQKITYKDKICLAVPFHSYYSGPVQALVQGATMLNPSDVFDPATILSIVEREEATAILGYPRMYSDIVDKWNNASYTNTSLRTGMVMGSACPPKLTRSIIDDLGIKEITVAYGLTEASQVVTQTSTDDPDDVRFDTIGRPLPGVEIKIIDIESGKILLQGERGELCVRSDMIMLGYYKNVEPKDAVVDKEGWLHTGDLATLRSDGNYQITGRMIETIISNHISIYPLEIEQVLLMHPDINDVAVVGVPDKVVGEKICAVIKLKHGSTASVENIMEFCRAKIAIDRIPHYILFIDEFPMTIVGKIQKFKVKDYAAKKLGLTYANNTNNMI
jgi:fatty-acyl-CoA synthase